MKIPMSVGTFKETLRRCCSSFVSHCRRSASAEFRDLGGIQSSDPGSALWPESALSGAQKGPIMRKIARGNSKAPVLAPKDPIGACKYPLLLPRVIFLRIDAFWAPESVDSGKSVDPHYRIPCNSLIEYLFVKSSSSDCLQIPVSSSGNAEIGKSKRTF